jgi:hypothetical protein
MVGNLVEGVWKGGAWRVVWSLESSMEREKRNYWEIAGSIMGAVLATELRVLFCLFLIVGFCWFFWGGEVGKLGAFNVNLGVLLLLKVGFYEDVMHLFPRWW